MEEIKVLIIGGAIANFTDVAKTFTGIIQAFENYADKMKEIGNQDLCKKRRAKL